MFDDMTGVILFKGANNKLSETFDGMKVTQILQKMFTLSLENALNMFNKLPFVTALGLNKQVNEFRRLQNALKNIIKNEYQKRYNQKALDDKCVLDIMIGLNKESEKETGKPKFSMKEIASTCELFQLAASDTSFHYSSTGLCYLALEENQKYQQRLAEEIQGTLGDNPEYSSEELSALKDLELVFKETGRMGKSAASLLDRWVTKDFDLCGIRINKGDRIRHYLINYQPEYYKDPFKFNPDRHDVDSAEFDKVPKLRKTPFSFGQRSCIGRYLGEMVVKLVIVEFLKEFEISVEKGYRMIMRMVLIYGVANPELILKLRRPL